jgi:hypothetical protein
MKTRFLKISFIGLAAIALFSAVVMLLWNALIPGIFGLTVITFWQAAGLLVLVRILVGGFGGRGRMPMFGNPGHGFHKGNPIHEKWMKMSPEEKKEFIERRKKFMRGGPFGGRDFFERGFDFGGDEESEKKHE